MSPTSGLTLATAGGGRLRQGHLGELVRRLARAAGIEAWRAQRSGVLIAG